MDRTKKQIIFPLFLYIVMCIGNVVSAQIASSLVLDTVASKRDKEAFILKYKDYNKAHLAKLKQQYNDKMGKAMIKEYEASTEELIQEVMRNQYVFDQRIDAIVRNVLEKFKSKDIPRPSELLFLINKDLSLNAYCLSDGLIMINIGVFIWLDNEEQLASILAHELGHYTLDHYNQSRYAYYKQEYSQDAKREVKRIKSATSNQAKMALVSLRRMMYDNARNRREQELQADSVGYTYYQMSGYKTGEYTKAMELMVALDTLPNISIDTSVYYTLFDLPNQPFKSDWLQGEDFSRYNYIVSTDEDIDSDSLLSHPEFAERIQRLQSQYGITQDTQFVAPSDGYKAVSHLVFQEIVPIFYFNESYGLALFRVIRILGNDPENTHYRQWMSFLFNKIYDARKSYTLNRYVESVDQRADNKSYQQFLGFLWALNLKEIETIAKFYAQND